MEPNPKDIQAGYDKVAAEYARRFENEQDTKPMDQEMLRRFADEVRGRGRVCDLGCGPGQIAAWLVEHCDLSDVTGIDLSSRLVEEARRMHPQIEFRQGDMLNIDVPDGAWAGATAFYCLIHIPHERLVEALKEIKRALKPGGVLLLTFHIGSEIKHIDEWFDQPVSMDFIFFEPAEMEGYLKEAGYERVETTVREPYAPEIEHQSRRAYIFARKPNQEG